MTLGSLFEKGIIFRLFFSALLVGGTLLLIHAERTPSEQTAGQKRQRLEELLTGIDRGVDSVLDGFGIDRTSIRKKALAVPKAGISRIERRLMIPPELPSVRVNLALNSLAGAFGGRAVGSENTREGTITIHIEIQKLIVESIVLKPERTQQKKIPGRSAK
jgi:hypothetical protein